jgi:sugar phosphate isomerase/epimerase
MRSSEVIREILDSVDSPSITANFDPVNLLDSAVAVFDSASRMLHMVDTVGPRYGPSCHVKDIRLTNEFVCHILEVPPGEGVLDYEGYFLAASKLPGPTALIVEHLSPEQSIEGVRFVREMAVANGIELL